MNIIGALGSGGMGMADMAWNIKCREEDMKFRRKEIEWHMEEVWWRGVNDRKREVEEKAKQLEQVASLSALIAGFALVAMVEVNIPNGVNSVLLILFGLTAASVVGLMLLAMLTSTFMLVAVMKYDVKAKDPNYPSFQCFWKSRCESDWRFSFRAFNLGIPLFMGVLAEVGWLTMGENTVAHRVAAASVSFIALVCGLLFYANTYRKWGPFLSDLRLELHTEQGEARHKAGGAGEGVVDNGGAEPTRPDSGDFDGWADAMESGRGTGMRRSVNRDEGNAVPLAEGLAR